MSLLRTLRGLQSTQRLVFPKLILAQGVPEPTAAQLAYLQSLASAAEGAANSISSNILTGSSESDDFCDLPVWLGQASDGCSYGRGNEQAVLRKLGLEPLAQVCLGVLRPHPARIIHCFSFQSQVSYVELSAQMIPVTVNVTPALSDLSAKLAELQELYCFHTQVNSDSEVLYSLLGKHTSGGWGGLVGIGIESDD